MEFKEYLNRHVTRPATDEVETSSHLNMSMSTKSFSNVKTRPFDAHHGATRFHQNPIFQKKLKFELPTKIEAKEIIETKKVESKTEKKISPEMHAYYFMELPEEKQDDLLVEHKIIVPDLIRKDLQKMSEFISNCKDDIENFVPINRIFDLLN